nr:MAG: hypothetical protein [Chemarfal virus 90]
MADNTNHSNYSNESTPKRTRNSSNPMGIHPQQLDRTRAYRYEGSAQPCRLILGDRERSRGEWYTPSPGVCDHENEEPFSTDEGSSWDSESAFGESPRDQSPSSYLLQEGQQLRRTWSSPWETNYCEFSPRTAEVCEGLGRWWSNSGGSLGATFSRHGEIPEGHGDLHPPEEQEKGEKKAMG